MRNRSDRISYVTAQRDYDHAEDARMVDDEPEPTDDDYWNGLDEYDNNE